MPYDPRFCWVLSYKSYYTGAGTGLLFAVTATLALAKKLAIAYLRKSAEDEGVEFVRVTEWEHSKFGKLESWSASSDATSEIVMIERVPYNAAWRYDGGTVPDGD